MIRALAIPVLALALGSASAQTAVSTVDRVSGQPSPEASIVYDPAATPAERHAAEELAAYLGRMSGVRLTCREATAVTDKNTVVVGQGVLAQSLLPKIDWSALGSEEIVIGSAHGTLVLAGGRPRGTIYAVYRLLGKLGVRWWTPWATDVPFRAPLEIPALKIREKPALEFRSAYWHSSLDPDWAVRNGVNQGGEGLDATRGGAVEYAGFVHTYYPLVPPKEHFVEHPEWYSLIDGKRVADNAQLCTTNPELRLFVLSRVEQQLRENPGASIVSVSQNDCFNPCQCDRCRARVRQEGSESALVLDLANFVADGIAKDFPHVAVDTLAYQWSRHAPAHMRPRPNVIVRLCSIECDFGQPLDAPKNAAFSKDVIDWSKLTDRLFVWDYVTNFAHYVQPLPDEDVLAPNLKFLHDHGMKGMFEEGDYSANGGGMSELKAWLLAQLLWNPNADARKLTSEFLGGYYGAAAKPIGKYLQKIDKRASESSCTIYQGPDAPYFDLPSVLEYEDLWKQAEHAVEKNPERLRRVRISHLGIQYVVLNRYDDLKKQADASHLRWPFPDKAAMAKSWLEAAKEPGPAGWQTVDVVSEDGLTSVEFIKRTLGGRLP